MPLPAGQSRLAIPLPDDLAGRNVLVEVTAAGKSRALPYYAAAMDVRVTETYGQLRAADAAGKPLAKVYVKVYARLADGQVKFHRDGYTDHRGRFDYASVSTPEKLPISRFSILALSADRGAHVREAAHRRNDDGPQGARFRRRTLPPRTWFVRGFCNGRMIEI